MAGAGGALALGWGAHGGGSGWAAGASGPHGCTGSRGPGLGTRGRAAPRLPTGAKADRPHRGLRRRLLASGVSNQRGPSNLARPLLHWLSARSTVSRAQGSGRSRPGGHVYRLPLRSGGAIWMVTGLCRRRGWRAPRIHSVIMPFGAAGTSRPRGPGPGRRLLASGTCPLQALPRCQPGGVGGRGWVGAQRLGCAQGLRPCSRARWRRAGLGGGSRRAQTEGRSVAWAVRRYLLR